MVGLVWVGLGWVGLGWVGLGWVGLGLVWFGLVWFGLVWFGWVGFGWVRLGWVGLGWVELGWVELGWVGLGWVGLVGCVCACLVGRLLGRSVGRVVGCVVAPNRLPQTIQNFASFPPPDLFVYLQFPMYFVDLRWSLRAFIIESVFSTHIWALWTPNVCFAPFLESKTPKPPTQVHEKNLKRSKRCAKCGEREKARHVAPPGPPPNHTPTYPPTLVELGFFFEVGPTVAP